MINGDKREHEAGKTLDLLDRIERVPPPPSLAANVMRALERRHEGRAPHVSRGLRLAVAGLAALAVMNVLTLVHAGTASGSGTPTPAAAADSLAPAYRLTLEIYKDAE